MTKLTIKIRKDTEIAQKILKKWQLIAYNIAVKSIMGILHSSLKSYHYETKDGVYIYTEEGDKDYISLQKRKFENFMFSNYSELKKGEKYKAYEKHLNNRFVVKVLNGAHKLKDKVKEKALRSALLGSDVLSFFTRIGIMISWEDK